MRKRNKTKLCSCGLCKPHKMGWCNRWKPREFQALKEFERVSADVVRRAPR